MDAPRPIELQRSSHTSRLEAWPPEVDEGPLPPRPEFSLPPVDGGKDAWFFLAASFMMEALTWGFPFSFGVFQEYYSTHEPFAQSRQIPIIGTCALGLMYFNLPIVIGIHRLYPRQTRWSPVVGVLIMCAALAASSFSQTTTHLILTQGVLFALGGSISYTSSLLYMDQWFVKRKGIAYGIMWSGTGLAGFVLPLLLEFFLDRFGFRTTLRIWAVILFVLTAPLARFLKPRLPYAATSHIKPFQLKFALSRTFFLHQVANIAQALGFFLPGVYLPSYARGMGANAFLSALTVLLVNVASVFGCILMGTLADRLDVTTCLFISTFGAAAATFLFWGFAVNLPILYIFCTLYGLFAGSYITTWTGIMQQITSRPDPAGRSGEAGGGSSFDPIMVIGILSAGRGLGNIISGPLSEALSPATQSLHGQSVGGYGSGYGPLIVVTGTTALAGGATFFCRRLGWM